MTLEFATEEWVQAFGAELNRSETYREAARTWEGDFYFVIEPSPPERPHAIYMYLDLWHGGCRRTAVASNPEENRPEFVVAAPLATWHKVVEKKLDPIQGLLTRQLKLQGPMLKVMRAPRAAIELVNCATRVETRWPGD